MDSRPAGRACGWRDVVVNCGFRSSECRVEPIAVAMSVRRNGAPQGAREPVERMAFYGFLPAVFGGHMTDIIRPPIGTGMVLDRKGLWWRSEVGDIPTASRFRLQPGFVGAFWDAAGFRGGHRWPSLADARFRGRSFAFRFLRSGRDGLGRMADPPTGRRPAATGPACPTGSARSPASR